MQDGRSRRGISGIGAFAVGWVLTAVTTVVSIGIQAALGGRLASWVGLAAALLLAEALLLLLAARERPGLRPKTPELGAGSYYDAIQLEAEQLRTSHAGPGRVRTTWLWAALPTLLTGLLLVFIATQR